jgi:hypothetical protein
VIMEQEKVSGATTKTEIEFRDMCELDKPFIYSTWLKNYKSTSLHAKKINDSVFFKNHHDLITRIMNKPGTVVTVAHAHRDPDNIYGYLAYETIEGKDVVHYVYVKGVYQRLGIAKALFSYEGIDPKDMVWTHETYPASSLRDSYRIDGVYDPYRI